MRIPRISWAGYLPLALALHASAQVYVVDAAGGAGAHFTDLPPAIAAVPEGATLLVLPGAYSPFRVTGRAITIAGEGSPLVGSASAPITIENTAATQPVVLRGLDFGRASLSIQRCDGPVLVEKCTCTDGPASIAQSRNVQILGCTFRGSAFATAFAATMQANDSSVLVADSSITGANALISLRTAGFPALTMTRSEGVFLGTRLTGGTGSPGFAVCDSWSGCFPTAGTAGGTACQLNDSVVTAFGSALIGGAGGSGTSVPCWTSCQASAGSTGLGLRADSTSRFVTHGDYALGEVAGTPAIGSRVEFVYRGSSQSSLVGVLVFADTANLTPMAPLRGLPLASTNLIFGPFAISTTFRIAAVVPPSAELGRLFFGQFWVLGSSTPLASNPFSFSVVR